MTSDGGRPTEGPGKPPDGPPAIMIVACVLVVVAPLTLVGWAGGALLLRATCWPRWRVALVSLAISALSLWVIGPERAGHHLEATAYALGDVQVPERISWGLLGTLAGIFGRGFGLATIAIPSGVLVAAIRAPHRLQPEWTPSERHRRERSDRRGQRRADRVAERPDRAPDDALGGWISGDLAGWRRGRYLVLPPEVADLPQLVFGASGSGKTLLLIRRAFMAGAAGRRAILVDCKGDAAFREQAIAAYLRARPDARVLCWPGTPLDGWRGEPSEQLGRLLQVWTFPGASKWYGEVAHTVLRLSLEAPGLAPVRSSGELMARLAGGHLQRLWDQDPDMSALLRGIADDIPGVELRTLNLLASLRGSLDGTTSWEDYDLIVCSIP